MRLLSDQCEFIVVFMDFNLCIGPHFMLESYSSFFIFQ
jgi:hypothetical protein